MNLACAFSEQEWAVLAGELRLKPCAQRDPQRSLAAAALLDEAVCEQLLLSLTPIIGSPSIAVTASLLGKRLAFLATGACLYAMSVYDKGLLLSLDNAVIEYGHDEGLWTSSLPLQQLQPSVYEAGEREAWRAMIVETLFASLLKPLWQTLARVSGVSVRILWDNTAVRVYSLYEKRMAKLEAVELRERCAADFAWLLQTAQPHLFGLDYNPLRHFRRPLTLVDDGQRSVRFRRTCCFYYQACNPVEYCSTCPLLRPRKKH
ncbi:IucA/IucC family C-terminal-domain containing protein [Pseudomonas paeninsulae]|uniref:IucA/IucC family C-terminal-domain containing protein n=1 Tax=Pseudomonas paeninsulae TaxID=3110772 RepID=UPI002D799ECA|nr:IucA/IucC family C-terminal-domain containing protein [Pseudomonas sp. IT1137]